MSLVEQMKQALKIQNDPSMETSDVSEIPSEAFTVTLTLVLALNTANFAAAQEVVDELMYNIHHGIDDTAYDMGVEISVLTHAVDYA